MTTGRLLRVNEPFPGWLIKEESARHEQRVPASAWLLAEDGRLIQVEADRVVVDMPYAREWMLVSREALVL